MSWSSFTERLEVFGGARRPPSSWERYEVALVRAAWWVLLMLLIWASAGRNTKFIYVDF